MSEIQKVNICNFCIDLCYRKKWYFFLILGVSGGFLNDIFKNISLWRHDKKLAKHIKGPRKQTAMYLMLKEIREACIILRVWTKIIIKYWLFEKKFKSTVWNPFWTSIIILMYATAFPRKVYEPFISKYVIWILRHHCFMIVRLQLLSMYLIRNKKVLKPSVWRLVYRLIIFWKPLLFTILSKNCNKNSTWQYCHVGYRTGEWRTTKRNFLKIINLYSETISCFMMHLGCIISADAT